MKKFIRTKLIHEGEYIAEVQVEFSETDDEWCPSLSVEEANKMNDVRLQMPESRSVAVMPVSPTCQKSLHR